MGQSKDSFYGQHNPERMPVKHDLLDKWEAYKQAGCLVSEMESACLFIVGAVLGCRTGASSMWRATRSALPRGLTPPKPSDTTAARARCGGGYAPLNCKGQGEKVNPGKHKADKKRNGAGNCAVRFCRPGIYAFKEKD